ncbi:MAG: hypothetical protein ACI9DC_001652 [Gammaproteobacteria bacterium]
MSCCTRPRRCRGEPSCGSWGRAPFRVRDGRGRHRRFCRYGGAPGRADVSCPRTVPRNRNPRTLHRLGVAHRHGLPRSAAEPPAAAKQCWSSHTRIMKSFDVVKHIGLAGIQRRVLCVVDSLAFEQAEEAFTGRVVAAMPNVAHGA